MAACWRAIAGVPVGANVPFHGVNVSAVVNSFPAEVPPTISTALLFGSKIAAWFRRGAAKLDATTANPPTAGSNTSAEAKSADPLLPPATRTLPSSNEVAECPSRGEVIAGPAETIFVAGSKTSL